MSRYSTRIAGMHLKDVHVDQAKASKAAGASYHEATRGKFTVWTEPGRGDIDLAAALGALPHHLTAGSLSKSTCPRPDKPRVHENFRSLDCQAVRPGCIYRQSLTFKRFQRESIYEQYF